MKTKNVDLEINEANDRDNNNDVNLMTIQTVKITNTYSMNNEKNKSTNNNGNIDDNVRLLMAKTMLMVIMEELVSSQ